MQHRIQHASVTVRSRAELAQCSHWPRAFADQRKDRRYYELVEDTIRQQFDYRYFVIADGDGEVRAVQPFFVLDQALRPEWGRRAGPRSRSCGGCGRAFCACAR